MINDFGLYLILTDPVAGYTACTEAAVRCGVRFVQLRIKGYSRRMVLETARALREITWGSNTLFIVNDDVTIAAEATADGVHLGQTDLPLDRARAFWHEPGKIYGLSTHNEAQAAAACALTPDYIGVGPVWPTPTKEIPDPALGTELAGKIIHESPLTTVAIGGIDATNLRQVRAAGAANFAVTRAVCQSPAPETAIRQLQEIWDKAHPD